MADQNSLGGRIKRYAQVSTTVGGLAARLAGERYLGMELDRGRHASDLTQALGGLKGPLMKAAQILSTIPDALPKEYAQELSQLQANAPAMGWPFVKRRMAGELGADWQSKFGSFEKEAARAASLGQVHRATDKAGRRLACKLQYPDMSSAVEADLKQLKLIMSIYGRYDGSIETGEIHAELADRLREELDYVREAKHLALYRRMLADEAGVYVPDVVPELSTERLLTMGWLEGEPILSAAAAPQEARNAIALNMFRAWYLPFYGYGVIHGDPHLGNYSVRPDRSINLLDFGCIRVFPARFVGGVIDLYWALARDDEALAIHAYETWGFKNLSREVIDALNLWARFLYAPLLENRARRIQDVSTGEFGREVAEKVHRELKRLGGVTPPREFVFMDRAAVGLGAVFMRLKADLNWYELFHDLIRDFDVAALERRQGELLAAVGLERVT
jgi:predicted unusual protein kinase regulating ubiquinone biosynthesis (AarF/ABC1/UbiB family)